jgi:two-component system, NtrC family, response regulator PilR
MKLPDSTAIKNPFATSVAIHSEVPAMIRVTFNDLARLPVERLAKLLMECAAEDPMLLGRLHATISEAVPLAPPAPAPSASGAKIVGTSAAIQHVAEMIKRFVRTDEPVLITGESGTGKELAARAIHETGR